jgi:hypothetical protein
MSLKIEIVFAKYLQVYIFLRILLCILFVLYNYHVNQLLKKKHCKLIKNR